jgi:hypothetical protein
MLLLRANLCQDRRMSLKAVTFGRLARAEGPLARGSPSRSFFKRRSHGRTARRFPRNPRHFRDFRLSIRRASTFGIMLRASLHRVCLARKAVLS